MLSFANLDLQAAYFKLIAYLTTAGSPQLVADCSSCCFRLAIAGWFLGESGETFEDNILTFINKLFTGLKILNKDGALLNI